MKKIFILSLLCLMTLESSAQISLTAQPAINLYPDSTHAPFIFGVTSGDPTDTSVIIWTAIPIDSTGAQYQIGWQVATDSTFGTVVASGSVTTDNSIAYTAKIDVQGLQAFTNYCYRFSIGGSYSVTGFTQTAPDSAHTPDSLSFALVSCSSLYSGYFNAYRKIAFNPGINAIVHVGDWIYDYVATDTFEHVRIPQPYPVEPRSLAEWRDRYRLYLLDPDLREARRLKPWVQMWDNHDISRDADSLIPICSRAYWEFGPCRRQSADSIQIWRKVAYGPLADIIVVDDWVFQGDDTFPDGSLRMLPVEQYEWLMQQMDSSTAVWKFIAVSKMFAQWNLNGLVLPGGGLEHEWEGFPECRDSVLINMANHHINNSVFGSGDLHFNILSDLAMDPFDSTQYSKATGQGSLGIEVNGISISRGNLDEQGFGRNLETVVDYNTFLQNPQQRYVNFYDNGYAILTFNRDSMIARMMLCPILSLTDTQTTDATLYCRVNDNHWLRPDTISTGIGATSADHPIAVYPNPSVSGLWTLRADASMKGAPIEVSSDDGQVVYRGTVSADVETKIDMSNVQGGVYFLRVSRGATTYSTKLIRLGSYW